MGLMGHGTTLSKGWFSWGWTSGRLFRPVFHWGLWGLWGDIMDCVPLVLTCSSVKYESPLIFTRCASVPYEKTKKQKTFFYRFFTHTQRASSYVLRAGDGGGLPKHLVDYSGHFFLC